MFFDKLKLLCDQKGISAYKACTDVGLNRAAVAKWKKGSQPSGATALKLADYFEVSVDYLLGNENTPTEYSRCVPGEDVQLPNNERNLIRIAARNGSFLERELTDQQLAALQAILDQMPDVPEGL